MRPNQNVRRTGTTLMPAPTLALATAFLGVLSLLTGCASLPTDKQQFSELVHQHVELGDTSECAAASMRELGLDVARLPAEPASGEPRVCLFCSKTSPTFLLMSREWRVVLFLSDESVSEIQSYVNVTAP